MLHVLSKFQTQRLDGPLTIQSEPERTPHETDKQEALNALSEKLRAERPDDQSLKESFELLILGILGKKNDPNLGNSKILSLFNNTYSWNNFGTRKCPRSAALALVAFTLKVFGDKIVNNGAIYRKDLEFAMNMLFGKNMVDIEQDVFDMVDSIRIDRPENGKYTLASKNYRIDVSACIPPTLQNADEDGRLPFFKPFVNAENIRSSFFHNIDKPTLHAFFGGVQNTPKDIEVCCEKSRAFQRPGNPDSFSLSRFLSLDKYIPDELRRNLRSQEQSLKKQLFSKKNTVEKSYAHSQDMNAGQIIISTQIKSYLGTEVESNKLTMTFMLNSAPSEANKSITKKILVKAENQADTDKAKVGDDLTMVDELIHETDEFYQRRLDSAPSFFTREPSLVAPDLSGAGLGRSESMAENSPSEGLTDQEMAQEINDKPVNVYSLKIERQARGKSELSNINLIASQCGDTDKNNTAHAVQIVSALIDQAQTDKNNFAIIDLREMIENNKNFALRSGNERVVFKEHTAAMAAAAKKVAQAKGKAISYTGIFHECHSNTEGAFLAVNRLTGGDSHPLTTRVDNPFDQFDKTVANLGKDEFKQFMSLYSVWKNLFDHRDVSNNAVRFACMTILLQNFLNKHAADLDPYIILNLGCWSAKDRTMAITAGIFMILPTIQRWLDEGRDISSLFYDDGTFNYDSLSPEDKLDFQKRFNLNLLHIENLINSGSDTNISPSVFKNIFPTVKFIQEADFQPVSTKR